MMPVAGVLCPAVPLGLAATVAAKRADSSGSGRTVVDAIMPLTCGDALQRTSGDVLWRLF